MSQYYRASKDGREIGLRPASLLEFLPQELSRRKDLCWYHLGHVVLLNLVIILHRHDVDDRLTVLLPGLKNQPILIVKTHRVLVIPASLKPLESHPLFCRKSCVDVAAPICCIRLRNAFTKASAKLLMNGFVDPCLASQRMALSSARTVTSDESSST